MSGGRRRSDFRSPDANVRSWTLNEIELHLEIGSEALGTRGPPRACVDATTTPVAVALAALSVFGWHEESPPARTHAGLWDPSSLRMTAHLTSCRSMPEDRAQKGAVLAMDLDRRQRIAAM